MSAGQLRVPGIKDGTSFLGAKAADWVVENTASWIELCRRILSPLPPQATYANASTAANQDTCRRSAG